MSKGIDTEAVTTNVAYHGSEALRGLEVVDQATGRAHNNVAAARTRNIDRMSAATTDRIRRWRQATTGEQNGTPLRLDVLLVRAGVRAAHKHLKKQAHRNGFVLKLRSTTYSEVTERFGPERQCSARG